MIHITQQRSVCRRVAECDTDVRGRGSARDRRGPHAARAGSGRADAARAGSRAGGGSPRFGRAGADRRRPRSPGRAAAWRRPSTGPRRPIWSGPCSPAPAAPPDHHHVEADRIRDEYGPARARLRRAGDGALAGPRRVRAGGRAIWPARRPRTPGRRRPPRRSARDASGRPRRAAARAVRRRSAPTCADLGRDAAAALQSALAAWRPGERDLDIQARCAAALEAAGADAPVLIVGGDDRLRALPAPDGRGCAGARSS